MCYSWVHNYIINWTACPGILSRITRLKFWLLTENKKIVLNIKILTSFFNSFYTQSYKLGDRRFLMLTNQVQVGSKNLIYIWINKEENNLEHISSGGIFLPYDLAYWLKLSYQRRTDNAGHNSFWVLVVISFCPRTKSHYTLPVALGYFSLGWCHLHLDLSKAWRSLEFARMHHQKEAIQELQLHIMLNQNPTW